MIKKLSCLFVFGVATLLSLVVAVQTEEPKIEDEVKVSILGDDDDDDDIEETGEGLTFLSVINLK